MLFFLASIYNKVILKKREMTMTEFEMIFLAVKPIVLKLKRTYYVQLWEYDDWMQEGRVVLYHLLTAYPELSDDQKKLCVYFKTKFSNYVNDVIRYQESKKRRFNRMPYEEVSDVGHTIAQKGMVVDDYVAYHAVLSHLESSMLGEEREMLKKLIRGERFKGKKKFVERVRPYFIDFRHY